MSELMRGPETASSMLSFAQAVSGREAQAEAAGVALFGVRFWSFDGLVRWGQIVVASSLADEVAAIFGEMLAARFPLRSVVPVVAFGWSDDASMEANNSSGFNPRLIVGGTRLSHHSTGRAIDINPLQNPFFLHSRVLPPAGAYDLSRPGTLTPDSVPVRAFESRGWTWGGRWTHKLDYHHFEKP